MIGDWIFEHQFGVIVFTVVFKLVVLLIIYATLFGEIIW